VLCIILALSLSEKSVKRGVTLKISTKGIYGLKAIVDLACYSVNEVVTIKSICERQGLSERYLEQIFSLLRKNGIIVGRKGSQGGYTLAKKPKELTVYEILTALEGELTCRPKVDVNNDLDDIISFSVWKVIDETTKKLLEEKNLEELVDEYNRNRTKQSMYYI